MSTELDQPAVQRPNAHRARMAIIAIGLVVVLTVVINLLAIYQYASAQGVLFDPSMNKSARIISMGYSLLVLMRLCAFAFAAGAFMQWSRRAYANLQLIGYPKLSHSNGALVWSWFIPLLNFAYPNFLMGETYKAYRTLVEHITGRTDVPSRTKIVSWWWWAWISMILVPWAGVVVTGNFRPEGPWAGFDPYWKYFWLIVFAVLSLAVIALAGWLAKRMIQTMQQLMDTVYNSDSAAQRLSGADTSPTA